MHPVLLLGAHAPGTPRGRWRGGRANAHWASLRVRLSRELGAQRIRRDGHWPSAAVEPALDLTRNLCPHHRIKFVTARGNSSGNSTELPYLHLIRYAMLFASVLSTRMPSSSFITSSGVCPWMLFQ